MFKYFQVFTVEGRDHFPFDMLRYETCFPYREEDSIEIPQELPPAAMQMRRVTLKRYIRTKAEQPTVARWRSYGWTVDPSSIRTEKL